MRVPRWLDVTLHYTVPPGTVATLGLRGVPVQLFAPQREHGIHFCRTRGRDGAGHESDDDQQRRDGGKGQRIVTSDTEEQRLQRA